MGNTWVDGKIIVKRILRKPRGGRGLDSYGSQYSPATCSSGHSKTSGKYYDGIFVFFLAALQNLSHFLAPLRKI